MDFPPCRRWPARLRAALGFVLILVLATAGCGKRRSPDTKAAGGPLPAPGGSYHVDLFKAEPRDGTAVVLLVDTSGSMGQPVKDKSGKTRPKNQIAAEALENIVQNTDQWKKAHPKANLQMAIYTFASSVSEVLPMGDFDADKARAALKRVPPPGSNTAIGKALEAGFKSLYRSGCMRKYVVCVTDGQNTTGPAPDWVARHLHARTEGEVEMHFVAFDTSANHFRFLKDINGHVVEASDGAKLQAELEKIYQERILVEREEPQKK